MMSPKKGSRQAMKHPSTIRNVLETRRTRVFLKHHTGACKRMCSDHNERLRSSHVVLIMQP